MFCRVTQTQSVQNRILQPFNATYAQSDSPEPITSALTYGRIATNDLSYAPYAVRHSHDNMIEKGMRVSMLVRRSSSARVLYRMGIIGDASDGSPGLMPLAAISGAKPVAFASHRCC